MLLKITERCTMGCRHCMNSATPDGMGMELSCSDTQCKVLVESSKVKV